MLLYRFYNVKNRKLVAIGNTFADDFICFCETYMRSAYTPVVCSAAGYIGIMTMVLYALLYSLQHHQQKGVWEKYFGNYGIS